MTIGLLGRTELSGGTSELVRTDSCLASNTGVNVYFNTNDITFSQKGTSAAADP